MAKLPFEDRELQLKLQWGYATKEVRTLISNVLKREYPEHFMKPIEDKKPKRKKKTDTKSRKNKSYGQKTDSTTD